MLVYCSRFDQYHCDRHQQEEAVWNELSTETERKDE